MTNPKDFDQEEQQAWITEIATKQRNLTWPDVMHNSRGVDAFFSRAILKRLWSSELAVGFLAARCFSLLQLQSSNS